MKTPMSEQAQLESYPRRNIKPVQHGANLVIDTAGARKQQNQTSCSSQDATTMTCIAYSGVKGCLLSWA